MYLNFTIKYQSPGCMVNHVRLKGGSGPAALSFRALNEKAPNLRGIRRLQGGGRFGSADCIGKDSRHLKRRGAEGAAPAGV
jgi:hypothetical protein